MINEKYLLERIMQGDALSFRKVFEVYIKKVYHFVYGYIKDKQEAEDVTQMVFQKLWENRTSINLNKSFDGFLFTIAYRTTIDHFRQISAKKHINTIEIMNDNASVTDLSADYLINQHQFESLYQKALNTLTDKRKEIFLLSRHDGLSNCDIAEKLNISVKTVENQMSSALSTLRDFFKKSDFILFCFFLFKLF